MSEENSDGVNFWPAFSDSMLAVILVLLLVLGSVYLVLGEKVKKAEDCQKQFAINLADSKQVPKAATNTWVVLDKKQNRTAITLQQDIHDKLLLHITFSESELFEDCDDKLGTNGRRVLGQIGEQIKKQANSIVEIGILGHADSRRPTLSSRCQFKDNLHLASARADSVFLFLQNDMDISPIEHAMSATSYGEFFPASRESGKSYAKKEWEQANATDELMQKNRRVELLLRYGTRMQGCQVGK